MQLDEFTRKLCAAQAEIFSASTTRSEGGSAVFVRRFMRSGLARRMDAGAFPFESLSPEQSVDLVEKAFSRKPYGHEIYSADEMYWMGYFYRAFCVTTGRSSKAAYAAIGARELRGLYFPYHSLDIEQAIGRVAEAKGLSCEDQIARGVSVLKRIRLSRS